MPESHTPSSPNYAKWLGIGILTVLSVWICGFIPWWLSEKADLDESFNVVNTLFSGAAMLGAMAAIGSQIFESRRQEEDSRRRDVEHEFEVRANFLAAEMDGLRILIDWMQKEFNSEGPASRRTRPRWALQRGIHYSSLRIEILLHEIHKLYVDGARKTDRKDIELDRRQREWQEAFKQWAQTLEDGNYEVATARARAAEFLKSFLEIDRDLTGGVREVLERIDHQLKGGQNPRYLAQQLVLFLRFYDVPLSERVPALAPNGEPA